MVAAGDSLPAATFMEVAYTAELDHLQARLAAARGGQERPSIKEQLTAGVKQAEQAQAEKPAKAKASRGQDR